MTYATQPADVFEPALTDDALNLIQAELEERARCEVEEGAEEWMEYLVNVRDTSELASIVHKLVRIKNDDASLDAWNIERDYIQWRVANADTIERQDIERELRERGE